MSKKVVLSSLAFLVIVAISAILLFPFESSGQITKLEQEAKSYYEQANFEESIAYYKEILELDPLHIHARLGLAKSYQGIARQDLAEKTLREGIQLIPSEPIFYSTLSDLFINQSDIITAINVLQEGIVHTNNADFKADYEMFLTQIQIDIERPFIQENFERSIHFVWSDEKGRKIPLEAEWALSNETVASLERDDDDYILKGLSAGTTILSASAQGLTRELEVEVKDQVAEELEWTMAEDPILATGQETVLELSAFDANEEPMDITPEWTLEKGLGEISNEENQSAVFKAIEDGVETVHASFDGITISMDIRIAGDKKTLVTSTTGQGTVFTSPQKDIYELGETIEIEAVPQPGWTFVRWSGDVTGTTPRQTITIDSHMTVEAIFESDQLEYELTLSKSGQGTILRSSLSSTFQLGETVTLTARPQTGYVFDSWTGSITSTNASITFTMNEDTSLRAIFVEQQQNSVSTPSSTPKQRTESNSKQKEEQKTTAPSTKPKEETKQPTQPKQQPTQPKQPAEEKVTEPKPEEKETPKPETETPTPTEPEPPTVPEEPESELTES
jgi:uncharacterized repeat protein (TIGR02543 family)